MLLRSLLLSVALLNLPLLAHAATPSPTTANTSLVQVEKARARATQPGQKVGAVYLNLTAPSAQTLVAVRSSAAELSQIHEMQHSQGVHHMREIERLPLPAGKTVSLAPGGLHIMLLELKQPLTVGSQVALELEFEAQGKKRVQSLNVPVVEQP